MTMVNDATEAALGLLGLTGSIDFSTTSTIPLKRKTSTTTFSLPPPTDDGPNSSTNTSDSISCICGYSYDDGFSVACDDCSRWVHAACFDINEGEVPEEWRCWQCQPRKVDRERAARIQKARQKKMQEEAESEKHRRRVNSPGVDRKRRASAAAIDGSTNAKRKRRYSVTTQQLGHQQQQQLGQVERQLSSSFYPQLPPPPQQHHRHQSPTEDEHIDIDEPAMHSYVHIDKDIVPHQHTRDKLKRLAQHWRGMTALDTSSLDDPSIPVLLTPDEFPSSPQTSLHPLSKSTYSHPTLSSHMNPSVRPPSYTVRTTQPITSSSFIAPYTSTIIPSTVYLSDPLNSYAHLGIPKPFVHLMGPPLDLALDARLAGNGTRFVRSGCRPNAVLRPMLCRRTHRGAAAGQPPDDDTLSFGVFALRDLKAHEEVVLGWEWDDGSVIHHLPALIDSPQLFAPPRFQQFRYQMTSMLHALSSTFTTCACGAKTRDCALNRLAEFVDGRTPPTPSPSPPTHHVEESIRRSDSHSEEEHSRALKVDLGPLVGVERGFRTRERVPMSGGMSGVEMVDDHAPRRYPWNPEQNPEAGPSRLPLSQEPPLPASVSKKWDRKGKGRATDDEMEVDGAGSSVDKVKKKSKKGVATRKNGAVKPTSSLSPLLSPAPPYALPVSQLVPPSEDKLPPKFRKKWIHKSADMLSETREVLPTTEPSPPHENERNDEMEVEDPPDGACGDRVSSQSPDLVETLEPRATLPSPMPPVDDTQRKTEIPDSPSAQYIPLPTPPMQPQDPTSPSTSFANLSLLSPLVNDPPSHMLSVVGPASPTPTSAKLEPPDDDITMNEIVEPPVPSNERTSPTYAPSSLPVVTSVEDPPLTAETIPSSLDSADIVDRTSDQACAVLSEQHIPGNVQQSVEQPPVQETQQRPNDTKTWRQTVLHDSDWETVAQRPTDKQDNVPPPAPEPIGAHVEEPPPPKVKLSLKDFALRKKRRAEENKTNSSPVVAGASLVIPDVPVPAESKDAAIHSGPTSDERPIVPVDESKPSGPDRLPDHVSTSNAHPDDHFQHQPDVLLQPSSPAPIRVHIDEPPAMSYGAKLELVYDRIPSPSPPAPLRRHESPTMVPAIPVIEQPRLNQHVNQENTEPFLPFIHSPSTSQSHQTLARQISREDGEIFSPPPPKPTPLAPRAYSPPTRPRSFHPSSESTSPTRPPQQPPRRPLQPAHRSQTQNGPPPAPRPLPSGPRALRGLGSGPGHNYSPFSGGTVPRAPSADRDRDHRMDWDRERPRPSWRGRGTSNGWGR